MADDNCWTVSTAVEVFEKEKVACDSRLILAGEADGLYSHVVAAVEVVGTKLILSFIGSKKQDGSRMLNSP